MQKWALSRTPPEHPVPIRARELLPRLDEKGPDVVDQDVEPSERLFDLPDQISRAALVREIGAERHGALPKALDLADRFPGFFRRTPIMDGDS